MLLHTKKDNRTHLLITTSEQRSDKKPEQEIEGQHHLLLLRSEHLQASNKFLGGFKVFLTFSLLFLASAFSVIDPQI